MKSALFALSVLLVFLLAGCNTNPEPEGESKETMAPPQNVLPVHAHEWLQRSRYHAELQDEKGNTYTVFLYAPDEISRLEDVPSYLAKGGDVLYEGTYQLAIQKKGDPEVHIQSELSLFEQREGIQTVFNRDRTNVKVIDRRFLAVFLPESSNYTSVELFRVEDGHLRQLTKEKKLPIFGTIIKSIPGGLLQTTEYNNSGDDDAGWVFNTWKVQPSSLELYDSVAYNDQKMEHGWDQGKSYYTEWKEKNRYIHPYRDLHVTKEWLKQAEKGKIEGATFGVGDSFTKTVYTYGPPFVMDHVEGGQQYEFGNVAYVSSDGKTISTVVLPGERVHMTLDQVRTVLGPPAYEGINELNGGYYFSYTAGNYVLMLDATQTDRLLTDIMIMKKK